MEKMQRNKITALMVLSAVLAFGAVSASAATKTTTIHIKGMHCNLCSTSVTKALKATAGVEKVVVNVKKGQAVVRYDDAKVSEDKLREVVNGTGFKVVEGKSAAVKTS
jgi:copper chaperone CopZ